MKISFLFLFLMTSGVFKYKIFYNLIKLNIFHVSPFQKIFKIKPHERSVNNI